MNVPDLRAGVLSRYRSIHAFCKAHAELKRATVYLVLSGKYPGNAARQAARIQDALDEAAPKTLSRTAVSVERIAEVLQACKCAHCRRPNRRGCKGCKNQTAREVAALAEHFKADGADPKGAERFR